MPRHVSLHCGIPIDKPAVMVNRLCGSGFQAVVNGAQVSDFELLIILYCTLIMKQKSIRVCHYGRVKTNIIAFGFNAAVIKSRLIFLLKQDYLCYQIDYLKNLYLFQIAIHPQSIKRQKIFDIQEDVSIKIYLNLT